MKGISTTSLRLSSATRDRLKIMALAQGVSQSELAEELIDREHALRSETIIRPWAAIAGTEEDFDFPQINEAYCDEEKPQRILNAEKAMQTQLAIIRNAEDAWEAAKTPEGAREFVEALRKGDISVVGGKVVIHKKAKISKTFPMVDLEKKVWVYDFKKRSHFNSLTLPQDIIEICGIEDQTYGLFTIIDDLTGKIIALKERFRISSGREMQILAKFRSKIEGLQRVRIQYHGPSDE